MLVYVDDLVLTGNSISGINSVKALLGAKFMIKDLGKLKFFLGIEVIYTDKGICLSQRKYCLEVLSEFGLLGSKPINTPIEVNVTSYKNGSNETVLKNLSIYQKLVGKLIYITVTRPDISFAVHVLSQFMHAPTPSHLKLAFRVLKYLKKNPGKGVHYIKGMDLELTAFVDSDWGKNLLSRKSITGFCIFLGSYLVNWKSKKQPTVSRSSAEAEYRAMAALTCELMWLVNLLTELKVTKLIPIKMYCDNVPAMQIAANPVHHERSKHFDIDWHIVREKLNSGFLKTLKVNSDLNNADIFTKGLSFSQHDFLTSSITTGVDSFHQITVLVLCEILFLWSRVFGTIPLPISSTWGTIPLLNRNGYLIVISDDGLHSLVWLRKLDDNNNVESWSKPFKVRCYVKGGTRVYKINDDQQLEVPILIGLIILSQRHPAHV
ncbi:uncharacterized mitochondrial protein AtMg00810-like [Rutidosis leptorrhynchoides]|uniref:uncharacterized mitochondrial protein AtMg00810-like n=1 Tax=Rutidosis leptorrhynchoides TaxID=125765 RepID=UPI003A99CBC9